MEEGKNKPNMKQSRLNWLKYGLQTELAEALVSNGFEKPTDVQTRTLELLGKHNDLLIAAKTGQGKTLCFGLPIMDSIVANPEKKGIKARIISPTRELAIQIKDHLHNVIPINLQGKVNICPLVGGMSSQKQERLLGYEPQIVVCTPGRLWELLNEEKNQYLVMKLPTIEFLVIDEADRMIQDGHFSELKYILNYIYTRRVNMKKGK